MKFVAILFVFLSLFTSCVTYSLKYVPRPTDDKADLAVKASARWASEIQFNLKVINQSNKTLTVDSDKFKLYVGELESDTWSEIPRLTSAEYYQKAEDDARNRPVVTITSESAPVYRRTTQTTTTTIGDSGSSVTIIRSQPRVYVEEPQTRVVTIVPDRNQRWLDWLKANLFYSVTLEPGKSFDGVVFGDRGEGTHYKLVLPVDGKDYEVVFERIKERSGPFTNLD